MHTIDAQEKTLGRVASEAARLLRGKDSPEFAPHIAPDVTVKVINVSQLSLSEKKKNEKVYRRFSGYPDGLKEEKLGKLIERKGYKEVMWRAVKGMLPANKLRQHMLKNLVIEE